MTNTRAADFLIIGAGMAGASCGYWLSRHGRVILLEREAQPGYHTTGRSAALYTETYGNAAMRALTVASRAFYLDPPAGFASTPLLAPRGTLLVARADQLADLERLYGECRGLVGNLALWSGEQVRAHVPAFRPDQVAAAVFEPDARDIDVHALHQGFLRGIRAAGGEVACNAEALALTRSGGWQVESRAGVFRAPVVVNAAGAWADEIGRLAGARPLGLTPLRRTAITFDAPPGVAISEWPAVIDVDEQWYFKPDAGRLLASPADETPSPPCDAQPDEYDIALLVERLTQATTLKVPRLAAKWAGLRSFVADRTIALGFDTNVAGFFWLAGQGGYGIQTAPAAGRAAAALARGMELPADIGDLGVDAGQLSPSRAGIGAG
jgi:D-arginine dehydrogenase